MSGPTTTAIIVTYNSAHVIAPALDEAARAHDAGELDVVVVDNASSDDTLALVRDRYPWVRVIESGANLGFGRGCNLGLRSVTTPYVVFLNPDAALPRQPLQVLAEFMDRHPQAAICGPATWIYGERLQWAGGLPTPWQIILDAAGLGGQSKLKQSIQPGAPPFRTDWIGGGIMFCRTQSLRQLGGFDPRFFLYFEETDLCRRAGLAGFELWAVGQAVAHHIGGTAAKATGKRLVYGTSIADPYFRSRFYYLAKHFSWPVAILTEASELALLAARSLAKAILLRPNANELAERLGAPVMRFPAPAPADEVSDRYK